MFNFSHNHSTLLFFGSFFVKNKCKTITFLVEKNLLKLKGTIFGEVKKFCQTAVVLYSILYPPSKSSHCARERVQYKHTQQKGPVTPVSLSVCGHRPRSEYSHVHSTVSWARDISAATTRPYFYFS